MTAEREQLAPEVLESIDALALYWSKTVVREATIRENLISLCREAAGYAKPSGTGWLMDLAKQAREDQAHFAKHVSDEGPEDAEQCACADAATRLAAIVLTLETAALAKPSLPPDGGDVLRPGGAWTPSDVPEQVLKDAKACLSSLLARPKERTKTNHILRVLIANITRRFVWFARDEQAATRPPEGRPNAE